VRILAIESSGTRGSVALLEGGQVVAERTHAVPNTHAETLVRLIDDLIAESGTARSSLDAVAVGLGPGSFTGLRVGVALARGLALGLGRPLRGVSSLRALALAVQRDAACPEDPDLLVGALIDARRGEYFFSAYERNLSEHTPPTALPQADAFVRIAALIGSRPLRLGGGALLPESDPVRPLSVCRESELQAASASCVGLLAQTQWVEADGLPLYLREADAVIPNIVPNALVRADVS
jgi:tRNA threonylcarbamoyladenosine biosynthesis protein TsaB